jgi:mono/diheme cytochrome c family protein
MKKILILSLLIIITLFVTIVPSCVVRKAEPLTQKTFVPRNEKIANGERLFMANCEKCHPGGEGGLGPAINANPAPQFVKRFQMRHGLGVMPAFKRIELSNKDLHDISKFLHAWKNY